MPLMRKQQGGNNEHRLKEKSATFEAKNAKTKLQTQSRLLSGIRKKKQLASRFFIQYSPSYVYNI